MRKHLMAFLVLCTMPLISQTAPKTATKPTAKKPVVAAAARPTAIIDTTAGKLTCTLFPDKAPIGVANFIGLATGTKDWTNPASGRKMHGVPLYSGTIFHRVIPEFMIQGGDPGGTGSGEIGIAFKNELHRDLLYDKPGRLAYANAGPDTNGSQFFVTEKELPGLDPCFDEGGCRRGSRMVPKGTGYTIFGQCDDASVEVVKKIARLPRDGNDKPDNPPKINKIAILRAGATHAAAPVHKPVHKPAPKAAAPATKPQ